LGSLVYSNSLNNKFLIDDYGFLSNPVLSGTKFIFSQWNPYREQTLGVMDSQENLRYYRPMAHIVLDLCYATFKNNYWKYHLLNLVLFVFASSLVYLLIEKVTGNHILAILAGLFYLIHPINGIVVNYISACVFTLQVIFMMGTILLLWESLERKNDRALYSLSLLFSFLSLFWHESGIMTPFYVSSVILLFRNGSNRAKIIYLFPYFLIVFFYIIFRAFFLGGNENISRHIALFHLTGCEYLVELFQVYAWYISKLIFPQGIVMQWAAPIFHDQIILNIFGLCLLCMIYLLFFVRFAKAKILQMAIIWTLIGFVPVFLAAVIRSYNGALIEPHWFIFSSIGFFILAAYFCSFVLDRTKKIGFLLLFILIFTWGSFSHAYNQLWVDQKTYALYWLQNSPYLKSPYFYLAYAYEQEGDLKDSKKYFRSALSGYPSDGLIYDNLGVIDQAEGHFKDAELNYKKTLETYPSSARTYYNLASLYLTEGRLALAQENFDRSLMINPLLLESRRGLALVFLKYSEYPKAIDLCLKNLDIVNDDPETLLLLMDILMREKDIVSLKKYAYRFINSEIDPRILTKLGVLMAQNNSPEIALDCFTKVMHVAPDYKDAYFSAGTLLANLGKYDQAVQIWKIGSSIDPSDQRFKKDIARAMALKLQ
jgi:tetratricopeptide (TPR) repeat protein